MHRLVSISPYAIFKHRAVFLEKKYYQTQTDALMLIAPIVRWCTPDSFHNNNNRQPIRRPTSPLAPWVSSGSLTGKLATLHHRSVLFLEALVETGRALQVLIDTAQDTLLFTIDEGFGSKVIHAVVKTALHHLGVHLM